MKTKQTKTKSAKYILFT